MKRMLAPLAVTLMAVPLSLAAQSDQSGQPGPSGMLETLTDPAAIGDAAQQAADQLAKQAKGKLLASETIGQEITGPGGKTVGTVEDLVVIPGGKVVAVLVKPGSGQPVALPYAVLKVSAASSAADKAGLSLPVTLDEARGMQGIKALTEAVTGKSG